MNYLNKFVVQQEKFPKIFPFSQFVPRVYCEVKEYIYACLKFSDDLHLRYLLSYFFFISPSVWLSICLLVSLSICLPIAHSFVCLSDCISLSISFFFSLFTILCLSVALSFPHSSFSCLSVRPSIRPSACPPVHRPSVIHPYDCLSICLAVCLCISRWCLPKCLFVCVSLTISLSLLDLVSSWSD